jgi:hypothetical protein
MWLATVVIAATAPASAGASIAPASVSPDVQVNTRAPDQSLQDFKSPAVAVNPANPNQVVTTLRWDKPDYYCQVYFSRNGGASWVNSVLPPPPLGTCWVPAAAFARDGHVYVTAQDRKPGGGAPQNTIVWSSSDGGATFGLPVIIPGSVVGTAKGPGTGTSYSPGIAVDNGVSPTSHPGRVYVTWETASNGIVKGTEDAPLTYSDDHGATWSTPAHGTLNEREQIPYPAVGPDGTVYIVFKNARNTLPFSNPAPPPDECLGFGFGDPGPQYEKACPIEVLRSTDGGNTIEGPFPVATSYFLDLSVAEQPGVAVAPPSPGAPSGTVLVTFATRLPGTSVPAGCQNTLQAVVYRSVDRGQTWQGPVHLGDQNPCTSAVTERDPWVSVAPNGRIDAIFYDNRNDPGRNHGLTDVYYANSTDGGRSFGPNVRLTPTSVNANAMFSPVGGGFISNEYDQVNGIDSTNDGAVAVWTDPRNATGTAAPGVTDVFSSRIGFAPVVTSYGVTNRAFLVGRGATPTFAAARVKQRKTGTTFKYILSEPARVRIVMAQRLPGRLKRGRCLVPTRKLRHARYCVRSVVRGTLIRISHQGANDFGFTGRIGSRALKPGLYSATLTATNSGMNTSKQITIFFTILKL